jgi:hypothetical protein
MAVCAQRNTLSYLLQNSLDAASARHHIGNTEVFFILVMKVYHAMVLQTALSTAKRLFVFLKPCPNEIAAGRLHGAKALLTLSPTVQLAVYRAGNRKEIDWILAPTLTALL